MSKLYRFKEMLFKLNETDIKWKSFWFGQYLSRRCYYKKDSFKLGYPTEELHTKYAMNYSSFSNHLIEEVFNVIQNI